MTTTHLLYLHGFRSSPQSAKAQQTFAAVQRLHPEIVWWCPQLPPSPHEAMEMVMQGIADWPLESMAVVGSSLGGFYATWIAERTGCRAVLLNPAVDPARDLAAYIGEQTHWHDPQESFYFQPEYVQELRDLVCGPLGRPRNYFCIIAKGDEVLDWREMHARYAACKVLLLEGGNHAISDYESHLPTVMAHITGD
ncbi:YqiA/YcfP family alpha/beta fold hydrolase [Rhodoferax sp. GW822-FHT02A01]|uniref:YqiA/YcfP family alpha/beta fold hydrolase n=1 Tax=Rhodoferax sp. GW822-FHT02A01 TaxID=3141537 RepID=UPI00315D56B7